MKHEWSVLAYLASPEASRSEHVYKMGHRASEIYLSRMSKHTFFTKKLFWTSIRVRSITFDRFLKISNNKQLESLEQKHFLKSPNNRVERVENRNIDVVNV